MTLTQYFTDKICKIEFESQKIQSPNERPIEIAFLFKHLTRRCPSTILDVGTGKTALPQVMAGCCFKVTAIDNVKDYWPSGMFNRHFHVINDDIISPNITGPFDLISCISVLEHIKNHRGAVSSIFKLLSPGGLCVFTFPYNEKVYIPNVYSLQNSWKKTSLQFVTQSFSRKEIAEWLSDNPWKIVEQEYWQFCSGEYWTCGERIIPPKIVSVEETHQLSCIALIKP